MNVMKYKGYEGSAEVSVEDGLVFGKILHIRDLVTFESADPRLLKSEFESAVDDYLADCQEDGREPDKPFKGSFNVRVSPHLHRKLSIEARKLDVSLNEYVVRVFEEHVRFSSVSDAAPAVRYYRMALDAKSVGVNRRTPSALVEPDEKKGLQGRSWVSARDVGRGMH